MFICIKELMLDIYDDDNEIIENEYMKVEKDSEWFIEEYSCSEGEIRLKNDNAHWIEINRSTFKEYFVEVITA